MRLNYNVYTGSDFKPSAYAHGSMQKTKNTTKKQDEKINKTLQGVILNTYIKDTEHKKTEMDEIANNLIIPDKFKAHPVFENQEINTEKENKKYQKRSLVRNALPYAATALLATGMALCVSNSYLKSQKLLKPGNIPVGAKLPTVGKNINLKTEEYFAIYMAISEPKSENILALLGILTMSALTYVGKTVVDASKKIWLKKQEADVKKNFEENVIDIETKSFAGKLDVVREELVEKTNYFKQKLEKLPSDEINSPENAEIMKSELNPVFGKFFTFRGNSFSSNKPEKNIQNNKHPALSSLNVQLLTNKKAKEALLREQTPNNAAKKDETGFKGEYKGFVDKFKDSPIGLIAVTASTLGLMYLGGRKIFKNMAQGAKIKENALNASRQKIRESLTQAVDEIKAETQNDKKDILLNKIKEKLLAVCADENEVQKTLQSTGLEPEKIQNAANEVNNAISKIKFGDKFYVQADPAMGGKEGTQFYIYIDQAKGYIYDVITHPENKFARYLFSAITATGATGYIAKESIDAMKESAVMKENSNTELELQKRLVDTEIRNFKSKKQSAIAPMMAEFDTKYNEGKPKEELKVMAENILLEIKNGPPFVYA